MLPSTVYRLLSTVFAVAIFSASSLLAQESVDRERLAEPEATFAEPFSDVAGLRELSDGTVLVTDMLERALRRVDFVGGSFEELGHVGQGPGEYQMPGELLELAGDSSLLVDFSNMRVSVVTPDGELADSESLMRPDGVFVNPQGIDELGRIYFEISGVRRMATTGEELPDSSVIVRYDRGSGALDTVATISLPPIGRVSTSGGFSFAAAGAGPFQAVDGWGVARDGRVAVVRHEGYHIEWSQAGRQKVVGPEVTYRPVEVSDEDKEAWADRMASARVSISRNDGSAGRSMNLPRPDLDQIDFPEHKPPFYRRGVNVTPEGEVWVQRYVELGEPETYDVFDAQGRRVRQVVLPEGREFVGFGRGTLYAVYADQDDLQWLERYRR
jgi:hypothetical protein